MKRGELVTIAMQGDLGKPRPALVIQSDLYEHHSTITVLPVTSTIVQTPLFRVLLEPSVENGLLKPSQIMVDKTMTVNREKIGQVIGKITSDKMVEVERCLTVFLGIA